MPKGTKNYFRHSFFAHENYKIVELIKKHGKSAYFHYFVLVELCAEQYVSKGTGETLFRFNRKTICDKLVTTPQRLGGHLAAIESLLGGHWVVSGYLVEIEYSKIPEYLGSYSSYMPQLNKTKINKTKIKEKNIKKEFSNENPRHVSKQKQSTDKCADSGLRKIVELWNNRAEKLCLAKVAVLNERRKRVVKQALKELPDLKDWELLIEQVGNRFELGIDNDRGWRANFDWLFRNNNYLAKLEEAKNDEASLFENDRETTRGNETSEKPDGNLKQFLVSQGSQRN